MSFHNDYLRVLPAEPYPERGVKTQLELLHNELQRALAKRPPYEQTERADLSIGVSAGFHDFFTKRQLSIPDNLVVTYRYLNHNNKNKTLTDIYFRDLEVELPVVVNDRAGYTVNLYRRVPEPKPARDLERPSSWRLVPKHVIDDVVARLEATESGDLLHDFESSIHVTDTVPADFRPRTEPRDFTKLSGWDKLLRLELRYREGHLNLEQLNVAFRAFMTQHNLKLDDGTQVMTALKDTPRDALTAAASKVDLTLEGGLELLNAALATRVFGGIYAELTDDKYRTLRRAIYEYGERHGFSYEDVYSMLDQTTEKLETLRRSCPLDLTKLVGWNLIDRAADIFWITREVRDKFQACLEVFARINHVSVDQVRKALERTPQIRREPPPNPLDELRLIAAKLTVLEFEKKA